MRAAYKRELKKVQDSKGTGAGLKDVYIPTLWYFEYLTFLDHKETLNRSGVDTLGICGDDEVSETQSLISEPSNPSAIKRRATNFQKKQEKLIECAQQLMSTEDGPAESYGRAIGLQLKDMNRTHLCIAEKLISEVIFFGKMEKLTLQSSIALNSYANSGNHPSASSSPIASSMSNSSDTLNIFPITHETMPISSISTLNEIPNDIQHAYNMQECLTFKNLQ